MVITAHCAFGFSRVTVNLTLTAATTTAAAAATTPAHVFTASLCPGVVTVGQVRLLQIF